MPTPIGNTPAAVADLIQDLQSNLANSIPAGLAPHHAKAAGTDTSNNLNAINPAAHSVQNAPSGPLPVTDVASTLLSEVATSDLTKLTRILDPAPDPAGNKVLDTLLQRAVQEVQNGNSERAVGYLADYATRDPRRAEALPLQPELEPVRDKIDSMVSRMASVAKMSAEDGLSRAEQSASELAGKISNWDTQADVLVKIAHRLFEAGGYANYSRTSEIAKVVSEAGVHAKSNDQVFAATAATHATASAASLAAGQMVGGVNAPYWVAGDYRLDQAESTNSNPQMRRAATAGRAGRSELQQSVKALKQFSAAAFFQLWMRAPLLVLFLAWLSVGLVGGGAFAIGSRVWPDSLLVDLGNVAFAMWGLGCLAMVGFGFYARIKYTPRR